MLKMMLMIASLISSPASAKETARPEVSEWVKNQINQFEQIPYTKDRVAFQRPFAWGVGTYKGQKFEWFAHSNTDAYLQFNLSVQLTDSEVKKLAGLEDDLKRRWEVVATAMVDDKGPYGLGTKTWIGASNDWVFAYCDPEYNKCDGKKSVERYVRKLNNHMRGVLALRTMEYLQ